MIRVTPCATTSRSYRRKARLARAVAQVVLPECLFVAAAVVERLAEREVKAFAGQRIDVRAPQRPAQPPHDLAVGIANGFGMRDADQRVVPGGIDIEDLPEELNGDGAVADIPHGAARG